eukprot:TRINITY_DN22744_c0_g1_i1.p1 TRINITY_DN22744_c0_g1~~TRINITY_DN22744_c0_g1_i1.p1  ORF type:complete len:384 (+),score=-7.34 TRINITY_DN22744_c0_g1_i1:36-1187(+)
MNNVVLNFRSRWLAPLLVCHAQCLLRALRASDWAARAAMGGGVGMAGPPAKVEGAPGRLGAAAATLLEETAHRLDPVPTDYTYILRKRAAQMMRDAAAVASTPHVHGAGARIHTDASDTKDLSFPPRGRVASHKIASLNQRALPNSPVWPSGSDSAASPLPGSPGIQREQIAPPDQASLPGPLCSPVRPIGPDAPSPGPRGHMTVRTAGTASSTRPAFSTTAASPWHGPLHHVRPSVPQTPPTEPNEPPTPPSSRIAPRSPYAPADDASDVLLEEWQRQRALLSRYVERTGLIQTTDRSSRDDASTALALVETELELERDVLSQRRALAERARAASEIGAPPPENKELLGALETMQAALMLEMQCLRSALGSSQGGAARSRTC